MTTASPSMPAAAPADGRIVSKSEERRVIFASSLGTVYEWYDFYLYATLAPFFASLFFPKGIHIAALLAAFATYTAGVVVAIVVMGLSAIAVGALPTYDAIGIAAPISLTVLRLLQGLALGGEYGGA